MKPIILTIAILVASNLPAMNAGKYTNQQKDLLTIVDTGALTIEVTRQVGGPGGISSEAVVPYPTVCRYKQWAKITNESSTSISYRVVFTHLVKAEEEAVSAACSTFVAETNGEAMLRNLEFTVDKKDFNFME